MIEAMLKQARDAVRDAASVALLRFAATLLACSALLVAAGAVALGLSENMPAHLAVLITAIIIGICASILFLLGGHAKRRRDNRPKNGNAQPSRSSPPPAGANADALGTLAAALIAQQARRAPLMTLAAAVATGIALACSGRNRPDDRSSGD